MKEDHKEIYRSFARDQDLPLFFQPWYLDAVVDEGEWDVCLAATDNKIIGIWPYFFKKRHLISTITHPHLTPYLGPYLFYPDLIKKEQSKRSFERKVLKELHDQLPSVSRLIMHGHPSWQNWRPLNWEGYQQTTVSYTHLTLPTKA